jgi:hypothetical protein
VAASAPNLPAASPDGFTVAKMLAHGFTLAMLDGFFRNGSPSFGWPTEAGKVLATERH